MSDQTNMPSPAQPNSMRRRLAKSGLAAPVILASLVSKPVLSRDNPAPYNCTISGQLSGNTSSHTTQSCASLGKSHSTLAAEYAVAPKDALKLTDVFAGLTNHFFMDGLNLVATTTSTAATINQILNLSGSGLEYAQKSVVLLLNSKGYTDTSQYPLTETQARNLYESASNPAHPPFTDTDPAVSWMYDNGALPGPDVKSYIDVLYH